MSSIGGRSGSFVVPGGLVELGYVESSTSISPTATTASGMDVLISGGLTVVCDGSPVLVEFFAPSARASSTASDFLAITLKYDGAVEQDRWGQVGNNSTTAGHLFPVHLQYRMTPPAGSHTFSVGAYVTSAARSGYVGAGPPTLAPMFLRVNKIVQQNDGFKPFWTPPLVTELPSNPTVGDIVIYAADLTNGVYWNLYYDGIGSYPWKYVGGPSLLDLVSASGESTTSSSYTALTTAGPTLTLPLAGDYDVNISAQTASTAAVHYAGISSYDVGATAANDSWAANFGVNYGPGYGSNADRTYRHTGLAASTSLVAKYRAPQSVQVFFNERVLTATPVRVAG